MKAIRVAVSAAGIAAMVGPSLRAGQDGVGSRRTAS